MTRRTLFKGLRFDVHELTTPGRDGQPHVRHVVHHPGAVVILPLLPDGRVVMIENHRPAVGETLLELPAGTVEPDEPVERTAVRELAEETGYRAGELTPLHAFYASPGIVDEQMHLYLATDLRDGSPARESGEQIDNRPLAWEEIDRLLKRGAVRDAKTLVGLLLYQFLRRADALPAPRPVPAFE